jgi:hypothetical protein
MIVITIGATRVRLEAQGAPERVQSGPTKEEVASDGGSVIGMRGTGYQTQFLCRFEARTRREEEKMVTRCCKRELTTQALSGKCIDPVELDACGAAKGDASALGTYG